MSSSRLILVFLGFILVIIVGLTSKNIADFVKTKSGSFLPGLKKINLAKPTVTPIPTLTQTPIVYQIKPTGISLPVKLKQVQGTVPGNIPATGPENVLYALLGGSLSAGYIFKKLSNRIKNK